jgi:uncharacterized membrane protein YuzA (DUF378 family)
MARTNEGSNTIAQVLLWLSIIGALNWGLVGFFDWDLVRALFGRESSTDASALARVIYAIVGLAGIGLAFLAPRLRAARTATGVAAPRAEARV